MSPAPVARPEMVRWYDPRQLLRTGVQTVLTAIFAQRADARLLMALGADQSPLSLAHRDALWVDFVADTGDGWRPTTAVLRHLADTHLTDGDARLPRGDLLVLGGDQVYPTASPEEYERRLLDPLRAVSADTPSNAPQIVAIPGNHDWYDGLAAFTGVFLQSQKLGMWQTSQSRSYQCVKLPHGHWLVAVDLQLQQDLDAPQRQWFERALGGLQRGDRVILCMSEPLWVFRQQYGLKYRRQLRRLLAFIADKGATVPLWLAGDLHHYRRLRCTRGIDAGSQLVTAGGGGAFLHPTHTPSPQRLIDDYGRANTHYAIEREYPDRETSQRLAWGNLAFPLRNPSFGVAGGIIYTLLSSLLPRPDYTVWEHGVQRTLWKGLEQAATTPSAIALTAALLTAVVVFTDSHNRAYRAVAGMLHGVAHLGAALLATGTGYWLLRGLERDLIVLHRLGLMGVTFALGYLASGLIMGVYLWVSVRFFRRHGNEAFSSLRVEGYKNFLRMKVDAQGITVWAFGIDDVAAPAGAKGRVIDRFEIPRTKSL